VLLPSHLPAILISAMLACTVGRWNTETEVPQSIHKPATELQQEAIQQARFMDMPLIAVVVVRQDGIYIEGVDAILNPSRDDEDPDPPDRSVLPCQYPCVRQSTYDELTVRLQEVRADYIDHDLLVGFIDESICRGVECEAAGRRVIDAASMPQAPLPAPYPAFVWLGAFTGTRLDAWVEVACAGWHDPVPWPGHPCTGIDSR